MAQVPAPVTQEAAETKPQPAKPQGLSANEIPERLQQTAAILRRARSHAQPLAAIQEIEKAFPAFEEGARSLLASHRLQLKTQTDPGSLRDMRSAWTVTRQRARSWQSTLKERSGSLQEDYAALNQDAATWAATKESAREQLLPSDLIAEIERTQAQIVVVQQAALDRRNVILKLQSRIADLSVEFEQMDETLGDMLAAHRGQLLQRDAPPIWKSSAGARPEELPNTQEVPGDKASELVRFYFLTAIALVVLDVAIFAVLAGFLHFFRKRALGWQRDDDPAVRSLGLVAGRPYSAALLATLLLGSAWGPNVPAFVTSLSWYVMLIPLVRIVPGVVGPAFKRTIWVLAGLFLADSLLGLLPRYQLSARLLLVALAAATAAGLIRYDRHLEHRQSLGRWWRAARVAVRIGIGLLAIAIVAEVAGATELARLLQSGVLRTVYMAVLLYASQVVAHGLIKVLVRGLQSRTQEQVADLPAGLDEKLSAGVAWVTTAVFFTLAVRVFQLSEPLAGAGRALLATQLSIGAITVTIGAAVLFLTILVGAVVLSRVLRFFLVAGLQSRTDLGRGTSAALSRLLHYGVLTAGFLVAIGASGIDLNKFSLMAGALGVGLGIGMQNIVNNFISGLILLFERPIHVGDQVTVGTTSGEVADIGIRASVIRTWDGADVVIPNGSLISGEFTNWTLSDQRRRCELRVGVAYGTDPKRVIQLLQETAMSHPSTLLEPPPAAQFVGFGDSSLDFVLRYWLLLSEHITVSSQIHVAVYERLTSEGIEIPFPQRDLNVKNVPAVQPPDDPDHLAKPQIPS